MSGLLAQVIVQLKSAVDQLDGIAARATRAAADAAEANVLYTRVGTGTDHPKLRAAVMQSRVGVDKAHRLARLSSDAARHIGAYMNTIAPGSASLPVAASGPPSGEEILTDSDRRALTRERMRGMLTQAVRKADELQERAANATEATQQIIKVSRGPQGPTGTHHTGTGTPAAPGAAAPRPKIDSAEAAGNLVVVGLLAGMGARWFAMAAGRMIARLKR
ncbi:hypothetical protein EYA84_00015 [Verrucosispora sp. SN26_14.1]|uniref:hypothetical protein n=1 Tax=Verrucosispora sp. SN26_14.1 TaxID=2527879 RepID=UPI0010334240|nr:hypothetical protein [Verrucosispora sp. SN26_14.1]TBL45542.1 hypothetical protein EYA84_00015 [Verrucosispora sp. SN26_14.1]